MNVLQLADWLRERGWNIVFFCNNGSRLQEKVDEAGFDREAFESTKKYFDSKAAKHLASMALKHDVKLLWIFDNKDLDVAAIAKRKYSKELKLIYQQHMQIGIKKKDLLHTRRYRTLDLWISPLFRLKNEVTEKTRFSENKTVVVPLGLNTEHFTSYDLSPLEAKAQFGLADDTFTLGCIGRIDPGKGQLFLCKALKSLLDDGIKCQLLIIGEPTINDPRCMDYFHEMEQFIKHNKLNGNIIVHPFIADVRPFFKAIDLFTLASVGETYGMVTIEALLSGVPVLGTNTGGTPEILDNGKYGATYTPGDKPEFNNKVKQIMSGSLGFDPQRLTSYASNRFDYRKELDQIEEYMAQLLEA